MRIIRNRKIHKNGVSAVEILIGVAIVSLILVFSSHAIARFTNIGRDLAEKTQTLYFAEEALETVRFARDEQWSNISGLTDGTTYYLSISTTTVSITGTPEIVEGYTRSFAVDSVERDGNDDIVVSGTPDPNSKYVTATVSWGVPTTSVSLTTIVADINNP